MRNLPPGRAQFTPLHCPLQSESDCRAWHGGTGNCHPSFKPTSLRSSLCFRYRMTPREPQEPDYQIRENLPRKTFDIDKGYAPVLDERGHFPVSAERFPLPVSIPQCPDTNQTTQIPVDITQGTIPRDNVRIEAPIFCSHPECHVYESTRLGVANQNKRTSWWRPTYGSLPAHSEPVSHV